MRRLWRRRGRVASGSGVTEPLDPRGRQWGVSYFGVRNPHHFRRDLEDIARLGFTYVVFTFSEDDHRFYQGSVAESVRLTRERGLRAYVDPWGVGGIFGGEAFTERGAWDLEGQQHRSDGRPLPLLCPDFRRHASLPQPLDRHGGRGPAARCRVLG